MDRLDPLTYFDEEKYIAMVKQESIEEGKEREKAHCLKILMKFTNLSAEQAMTLLEIPEAEQKRYLNAL